MISPDSESCYRSFGMDKNAVMVEVICPSTSRTYDFVLCTKTKIGSLIKNIIDEISGYESNEKIIFQSHDFDLFSNRYDDPLDAEKELGYYMIMSGDRLMLV